MDRLSPRPPQKMGPNDGIANFVKLENDCSIVLLTVAHLHRARVL